MIYEYQCPGCKATSERWCHMNERNDKVLCDKCNTYYVQLVVLQARSIEAKCPWSEKEIQQWKNKVESKPA